MRHNKMAGNSEFLLGKELSGEELIVSRKRKPSPTFTNSSNNMKVNTTINNMLHSKSTYFYRWFNSKKSIEGHSFSNTTYLIPSVCGVALLIGLSLTFNPITHDSNTNKAHAETVTANPTSYSSVSMTIGNSASGELSSGDTITTNVEPGLVSYIDNNIKISTSKIDRFYVTVQAAEDSTSSLTGTAHGEAIAPVGSNVSPADFSDNTWGYALGDAASSSSSFIYNSLPTYNTAITPQYTSAQELADGDYNLKLTFAAKINADKPSDHYITKAMVSVAADAKEITTMQEFAEVGLCSSMKESEQRQLIDDRTASGAGQKKYWIGKVNGQCIMAQNLDLDIPASGLKAADTDLNGGADWDANSTYKPVATMTGTDWDWTTDNNDIQSYDPGEYIINQAATSWATSSTTKDPTKCSRYTTVDSSTSAVELHYAAGNYYSYTAATAGTGSITTSSDPVARDSICPKGWMLFDDVKSFGTILAGKDQITVRQAPTYFPAAGYATPNGLASVGAFGRYRTSVSPNGNSAYILAFVSDGYSIFADIRYFGFSVRCVAR